MSRLRTLGWYETAARHREEMARLPDDDPTTHLSREILRFHAALFEGDSQTAIRIALRAIRHAPRDVPVGLSLRGKLAFALFQAGELDRAEELYLDVLRRGSRMQLPQSRLRGLLNDVALLARRRGELSKARKLYEASLQDPQVDLLSKASVLGNLIHVELRAGDQGRARMLLEEMDELPRASLIGRVLLIRHASWLSYWIDLGDPAPCAPHLEGFREYIQPNPGSRDYLLFRNYEADVLLVEGRHAEALAVYESALEAAYSAPGPSDLVAPLARGAAEALHAIGEHERAENRASIAIRDGGKANRLEELIGLRIQAQCQWVTGRQREGVETFERACRLHLGLEFGREREQIAVKMKELGVPGLPLSVLSVATTGECSAPLGARTTAREVVTLGLADGREFLTSDIELHRQILLAAGSDLPVLIEGETGTGKELVALLLHESGPARSGTFSIVDCTAPPDAFLATKLFREAFEGSDGADEAGPGASDHAKGVTLFLDELSDLPLTSQAKLLRLLQERSHWGVVGGVGPRAHVRFIAATNRPVSELLDSKLLRGDLFHRLNGHRIRLRPLRERRGEIPALVASILRRAGGRSISPEAVTLLQRAPWPGNVRELEMVLRVASREQPLGERLEARHLSPNLASIEDPQPIVGLKESRLAAERTRLEEVLRQHGGSVAEAARALGITRQAFYKALQRTRGLGNKGPARQTQRA